MTNQFHRRTARSKVRAAAIAGLLGLLATAWGCSKSVSVGSKTPKGTASRPLEVKHEECTPNSKEDANGDGKPELQVKRAGGREECVIVDFNSDGIPEIYKYFDSAGNLRRKEFDQSNDGRINQVAHFKGGVQVRGDNDVNRDGKFDLWQYFEGGKMVRYERDSDYDGKVDEWWNINAKKGPDCAIVVSDKNGDGKPDPNTEVDTCEDEYADLAPPPPPAASDSAAPADAPPPAASAPTP